MEREREREQDQEQAEEARAEEARRAEQKREEQPAALEIERQPESHAAEAVAEHDEARRARPDIENDIQGFIEMQGLKGKALFVVSEFTPISGVEMEIEEAGRLEFSTLPEALRAFEKDEVGQMSRASIEIEGQAVACKFAYGCMNQAGDYKQQGETWRWKHGGGVREAFNVPTEFMIAHQIERTGPDRDAWEAKRTAHYARTDKIDGLTWEELKERYNIVEDGKDVFTRDDRFPYIQTEKNAAALKWALKTENEEAKEELNNICEKATAEGNPAHVVEGYKEIVIHFEKGLGLEAKTVGELVKFIRQEESGRDEIGQVKAKESETEREEARAWGSAPAPERNQQGRPSIEAGKAITHKVLEGATILADKALELVSEILDFFAPPTPHKITPQELFRSAEARQERAAQLAAEAKAEQALESIIEDRKTGRCLEVADFHKLSRDQLEAIKAHGLDDGLKLLADEKLKTHQHERGR